jgi:uncharacterized membrane protein YjjP (DUF1212 family)
MATHRTETEMLAAAGRLLVEFNESTGTIERTLATTARALTNETLEVTVMYGGVVISLGDDGPLVKPVRELRYNAALQARVHSILRSVRDGGLSVSDATDELARVEADTPRHSRWIAILVLGVAASALAALLGADVGAVIVAGVSTAIGLFARQELGRRHVALLALPFTAAFFGAVLGGIAIRLAWTQSPGLVLIVPSLMLIPGPHLINGLLDLIDNYVPMSIARLGLANAIVVASAFGIVLGIELTLWGLPAVPQKFSTDHLNLASDMVLAAIVTCGFAMYYNAAWSQIGMAALGGMAGHGVRYVALNAGCRLEIATFLGGLAVGVVASFIVRAYKVPFAVIAFAGAVTMMPGVQMYLALSGVLQLAQPDTEAKQAVVASTLGNAAQASLVIGALALGLVIADRMILSLGKPRN